ncbi:MAG: PQQ-binding-like beta-propeller repeat protein, partial [Xanthomonadaceae bacterium]|nr:PQQ-binding-like beta-propeller repeat protein [Xanthomonadaceae bacterium]
MRANPLVRSVVAVAGIGCGTISAHATDWLQFGFDPAHSGNNPSETILSASGTGEFALTALFPIYNVTLPDVADGAPAFLSSVTTANGVRDLLFLETKGGHVLALDAATGATVWSHATKPTPPPAGQDYTTSSPAIDPNRQYVYFYGLDGNAHKYAVGTGLETSSGGWPERATLKPDVEKGSSALAIAIAKSGTTYLYVANGGY